MRKKPIVFGKEKIKSNSFPCPVCGHFLNEQHHYGYYFLMGTEIDVYECWYCGNKVDDEGEVTKGIFQGHYEEENS